MPFVKAQPNMPEVMKKTEARGLRKEGGADKNILKQTESLATVTQRMGYTIAAEEIVKDLVFQVVERDIQKDKSTLWKFQIWCSRKKCKID